MRRDLEQIVMYKCACTKLLRVLAYKTGIFPAFPYVICLGPRQGQAQPQVWRG